MFSDRINFWGRKVALILGFPPPKNSPDICNGKFTMLRAWPYGNKLWDNAQRKGGERRRAQEGARSSKSPMRVLISCSMQTGKKISFLPSFCFIKMHVVSSSSLKGRIGTNTVVL